MALPGILCGLKGVDPADYREYLVCREEGEAVAYLFALASGLRSMILGEDQILAQVKRRPVSGSGGPVLRRHPGGAVPPRGDGSQAGEIPTPAVHRQRFRRRVGH